MGPGYFNPPTAAEAILAVIVFAVSASIVSMLTWWGVRRLRNRALYLRQAALAIAGISLLVGGVDVSFAFQGTSGIFSIFRAAVIPIYIAAICLASSIAATVVP